MPIHEDFQEMYNSMIKEYGKEKGESVFYATCKEKGQDYTKPRKKPKSKSYLSNVVFKSIEAEGKKNYHITGFVSAPSPDKDNDFIPESLQSKIVDRINSGFANRGSWNHDFIIEKNYLPVGSAKAELKLHPELNKNSAWVDVILDSDSPKFNEILNYAQTNQIKGFSIEYIDNPPAHIENINGTNVNVWDDVPIFGFGIIGGNMTPRNDMAYADGFEYKAYFESKGTEVNNMTEINNTNPPATQEISPEMKARYDAFDTWVKAQKEEKDKVQFKALVEEQLKVQLKALKPEEIPNLNPSRKFSTTPETIPSVKAFIDTTVNPHSSVKEMYKAAAELHTMIDKQKDTTQLSAPFIPAETVKVTGPLLNSFEINPAGYKAALESATNKISDTDYYQTSAGLRDIYDPVIRSHLNDQTVLYGKLRKVDASSFADRYGFEAWTGRIAGMGGSTALYYYSETPTTPTGYYATEIKCQIPFQRYGVCVQVAGFAIAAARCQNGIGDLFSKHIERASADLLRGINADIFYSTGSGDAGMTANSRIMSLPYLLGTSDLYGLDRSGTYTTLQGTTTAKSGTPNPSKPDLRTAIRTVEKNDADRNNLIFVCDHIQKDKILGLFDDAQRFMNTSARAGFEGLPTFDGIPIYADEQCDDGYIYILDMEHTVLAIKLAPTYEDLAKTDDSKKGFIKTYFALVCTAPNHNYLYTGYATS